jgi:hypothetical protein
MKGKILFLTGLGVGYVLGTRAGRERYEQIKQAAGKLWNDPRVQRQVDTVGTFVKDKAPDLVDFVADNAKKVAAQVSNAKPSTKSSASKSSAAKSSTAKSGTTRSRASTASGAKSSSS